MLSAYARDLVGKRGWAVVELPWTRGEAVLVVSDEEAVQSARKAQPGLADYLIKELDLLRPLMRDVKSMRGLHRVKKILGGRVRQIIPHVGETQTV